MRVRRIVEEHGCGYEARIAALAQAFNEQVGNPKGATALVKIHEKLSQAEGRAKEGAHGPRSVYLQLVAGRDRQDSKQLPGVLGRVCEDTDEDTRAPATYLQQHTEGPDSKAN